MVTDESLDKRAERAGSPGALRPHPSMPDYYGEGLAPRRAFLRQVFDDTAADYDRIESMLAWGSGRWYRRQALLRAGLASGMAVCDVGCGTGLVTREALAIVGENGSVLGVDPSPGMMNEAHLAGRAAMVEGRAEAIPRPDASFDFVTMGYALRHVDDVAAAFSEFRRVLRPGGRVLVLEITRPEGALARTLLKAYMHTVVPLLAGIVSRRRGTRKLWRYYWDTIEACIAPPVVQAALEQAGFTEVRRYVELGIFSEYTATVPKQP
ncbi:MAG: class I SAM-dependent methyltransferase [Betaproteobacteria bacterium]|jgi:demethylmenaquinone methyltransferase/2-methoxy-6-polyprenyl-1,4-benzoquinol methylase|nr:class I SAM-dependent methyltransferase [Betaproteobacteria bacterium]MCC6250224.1 class I SAM-dependent methyltransferase [Rubrivivax sp.]MCL4696195.1 class I SAM-dependent methyltransferase [Burkholderiaceae bacterium]